MRDSSLQTWIFVAVCLAAVALWFAPQEATGPMRTVVQDALQPGQSLVRSAIEHTKSAVPAWTKRLTSGIDPAIEKTLRDELDVHKRQTDRLLVEQAELRGQLADARKNGALLSPTTDPAPLYHVELVRAQILGTEAAAQWRARPLLSIGAGQNIRESALVLDNPRPLVDQGANVALEPDQAVFAANHPYVVGKIARVGRLSSTLCLVTDTDYAGAARLVRRTAAGLNYGASGTLVGDGHDQCKLLRISRDEPAEVGDLVVTADTEGRIPPQIYGEVTRVNLTEGNLEWDIQVRPLARCETDVLVMRSRLNH